MPPPQPRATAGKTLIATPIVVAEQKTREEKMDRNEYKTT
jgi:hypothetical protein